MMMMTGNSENNNITMVISTNIRMMRITTIMKTDTVIMKRFAYNSHHKKKVR